MADGYEVPEVSRVQSVPDALIQIAIRLGGVETALKGVVSHEKLITILNEQRKEITGTVRDSEAHVKGTLDSQSILNDRRHQDLQTSQDRRNAELLAALDGMMKSRVAAAVNDAVAAEKARQDEARKEIDFKAKDAARGVRLIASTMPPIVSAFMVAGAFVVWMWVTGKL